MDNNFKKVVDAFYISDLDIAYNVLGRAFLGGYGGKVEMELTSSGSSDTSATVKVQGNSRFSWGDGWSEWSAKGIIDWITSSGHRATFYFECPDRNDFEPTLKKVEIGNDESAQFYPKLKNLLGDICQAYKIG